MPREYPYNIAELRRRIASSISLNLRKFLKSDRLRVKEALSLLATDRTIHPESMRIIRSFYEEGKRQQEAFFATLMSLEPRKVDFILNQIHAATGTPEWLIGLRADLNSLIRSLKAGGASAERLRHLRQLSEIFTDHFMRIFNFQYLVTRLCDAQSTSVALLKFISEKEGVHPAKNWWSFENRLNSPDHIILSLEHFKMPYVPLVYVEVALSRGLVHRIDRIIGEKRQVVDVARADTAIFYSLNTTMAGLRRIGLGGKMIIRAREYLEKQYPQVKRYATLSPLTRFRHWLDTVLAGGTHALSLTKRKIDINKRGRFISHSGIRDLRRALAAYHEEAASAPLSELLKRVLAEKEWFARTALRKAIRQPMVEIARYYLEREKRLEAGGRRRTSDAYDPVENFHLSNGAFIGRINYLANLSERGLKESYGMMVNYVYDGAQLDRNKLLYSAGKVVCRAP